MKNNKKKNITQGKKRNYFNKSTGWTIFGSTFLFLVIIGFTAYMQMHKYEEGILEVYAHQQDGYVQLVLDQINLVKDRSSEEIVTDILSTLDASTYRYWTFDEDKSIVFVKDVLETNKYKSFTSQTYYSAIDIDTFVSRLRVDSVIHDIIESRGDIYVTSGVKFEYAGKNYTLCLMTESKFILDQNEYMGAKIVLSMLGLLLLLVFFIGVMALVLTTERWYRMYAEGKEENKGLTAIIGKQDDQLSKARLFNTQENSFLPKALPVLFRRLDAKEAFPLLLYVVQAGVGPEREAFFQRAGLLLDRKTVRAVIDNQYILLISLKHKAFSEDIIAEMENKLGCKIVAYRYVENGDRALSSVYEEMIKEVK